MHYTQTHVSAEREFMGIRLVPPAYLLSLGLERLLSR